MKILLLHNAYRQAGGEDVVVGREHRLLAAHGHEVNLHQVSNDSVRTAWDRVRTALQTPYSIGARRHLAAEIRRLRPDVVHVHNFFPLLSPSVYDACRAARRPVVQTLHNYRPLCLNGIFLRNRRVCEDCLATPVPWPGVIHACYRDSRAASGTAAAMVSLHRALRTWATKVDVYITPTEFARQVFVRSGFPAEKIVVKPHFVDPDPGPAETAGEYALFVGRLAPEKGVGTLLAAWSRLAGRIPLKIVGDGPLASQVRHAAGSIAGVEWLREQSADRVVALMKGARALLFPSLCYESFGMVIVEAYAIGLPVIAAAIGSGGSLIVPGTTGLLFRRDDPEDLAAKVGWLWTNPDARAAMSRGARRVFERDYTAEPNYRALMNVYRLAAARSGRPVAAPCLGSGDLRMHRTREGEWPGAPSASVYAQMHPAGWEDLRP